MSSEYREITIDFLVPYGGNGGVEHVLNELAIYLLDNNIHVRIIQLEHFTYRWADTRIDYYPISTSRPIKDITDYIPMCEQYINKLGAPDILIVTPWPMLTMIARLALINTHANSHLITWLHGPVKTYETNAYGGVESLSYADLVLVLSRKSYNYIHSANPSINVRLIHNPINISSLPFHAEYNLACRNLVFVGRLSEEKRVDIILKALSMTIDTWTLSIYGDGDKRAELQQLAISLNISDRITFHGWTDSPWNSIGNTAALILASEYEGFSLVCYESLACGIPVISTPVNGVIDIIEPGVNGFLYPHNNPKELATVLDNIGSEILPPIDPYVCHNSVADYDKNIVFKHIMECILSTVEY